MGHEGTTKSALIHPEVMHLSRGNAYLDRTHVQDYNNTGNASLAKLTTIDSCLY